MDKYCFIYNPGSRRGRSNKDLEKLRDYVSDWKGSEIFSSTQYSDLSKMAEDAALHFDTIVACGGDGTVREVASGLINSGTKMGIIPMGSGNDFAKSMGIPHSLKRSLEILKAGSSCHVDIGTCNDLYFINTLGFGFDGYTNRIAAKTMYLNGMMKYIWAALRANFSMEPFSVKIFIDDHKNPSNNFIKKLLMVTAANGRVEGGRFNVAPEALINDGKLNLVTVESISKIILPFVLPLFWWGKQHLIEKYSTREIAGCRLNFENPPHLHADGEIIETHTTEFTIGIIPQAVQIIGL